MQGCGVVMVRAVLLIAGSSLVLQCCSVTPHQDIRCRSHLALRPGGMPGAAGCMVLGGVPRPDPAMFSMQGPRQTLNHLINYFQQMEINGLQQVLSCYELCPCKAKYCKLQRGRAAPAPSPTVDTSPATS